MARPPVAGRDPQDSGGVPWAGRTLPAGGFDGDDGSADAALVTALDARRAGRGSDADVVAALSAARLLVPVVAVLGEAEQTAHGTSDKQADMAMVTLTGPDGRRALPVFSSVAALSTWDPAARPVPTDCRRAVVSAVAEGCDLLVLDPAGPVTFVVSRPALWAIGQGRRWVPAHEDAQVLEAVRAAGAAVPQVARITAEQGESAELRVVVAVPAGLEADQVQRLAAQVGEALTASAVVRERVDGVELAVVQA